jgi:hypothetical protein
MPPKQSHGRGMIAETGGRWRRFCVGVMHGLHQSGPCPIGRHVVTRLIAIVPDLAVAGEMGVDQAWIVRRQVMVCHAEFLYQRALIIGDENVSAADDGY